MAKSDKRRASNKNDEQQILGQSYLTGLQSQLAGQYGNYGNMMFGSAPSPTQNTFGWGTTTPQFSWTGQSYFPGSTTGNNTPYGASPYGRTAPIGGGTGQYAVPRDGTSTGLTADSVRAKLMPYLQSLGGADSATLERAMPEIQRMFPGARFDTSSGPKDEIVVPGVGIIDLISNAEGSGPKNWTFQTGGGGGGNGMMNSGGIFGQTMRDYGNIMNQYQNWANTGGMSEQDKANLRQRAISPIRSIYAQGNQQLARQRALQGGYAPGYATALSRMNRDRGQAISDATGNAEANITDMMLRGKQFGMGGMSSLYGQTPGMASTMGNQMLAAMEQQLRAGGLQNQLGGMLTGNMGNIAAIPGFDWGGFLGGIGNLAGGIGMLPWGRQGG